MGVSLNDMCVLGLKDTILLQCIGARELMENFVIIAIIHEDGRCEFTTVFTMNKRKWNEK